MPVRIWEEVLGESDIADAGALSSGSPGPRGPVGKAGGRGTDLSALRHDEVSTAYPMVQWLERTSGGRYSCHLRPSTQPWF